jgi:hypothetical protein
MSTATSNAKPGRIFAVHGSDEFNQRIDAILKDLAADVEERLGSNLYALVLGGGYGRGEGGVVRKDGVEHPYNDLDMTIIVSDPSAIPEGALHAVSEHYEKILEIDVDFSRPLTPGQVRKWPHSLMWYDLLNGYITLAGPPDALHALAPSYMSNPVPAIEGTRLALNRGTGILWSLRILRGLEPLPHSDFLRRNYYKAVLAMGDALLIAWDSFATPYTDRDKRLASLATRAPEVDALGLVSVYEEALRFKFEPSSVSPEIPDEAKFCELAELWGRVFLAVESKRTGQLWRTLDAYCATNELREPGEHVGTRLLRNVVQNGQLGRISWRYPRESLYRELPVLLDLTRRDVLHWDQESSQYLKVWERFN